MAKGLFAWSGALLVLFGVAYLTMLLLLVFDRRPPPSGLDGAAFRAGRWAQARATATLLAALLLLWGLASWAIAYFAGPPELPTQ